LLLDVNTIVKQHLEQITPEDSGDDFSLSEYIFSLPAYKRYAEVTQILDTIILDINTLQYKPQALVLSAIYCVILLSLKIFTPMELTRYEFESFDHQLSKGNFKLSLSFLFKTIL